jgi:hypothetical protein
MKRVSEDQDLMDLLSDCDFDVIEIINKLRKIIYTKFPEIEEKISFGSKGIGYAHKNGREIVRIFPESDCAKLGFEYGDKIIDKYRVFIKSDKATKYIKYKSIEEINPKIINEYLDEVVRFKR